MTDLSPEAQAQLAKLATDLAHNPKTRKAFTKLVQEIDPSKRFPDVEIDDIRASVRQEFEDRDAARQKKETLDRVEAQKNSLRTKYKDEDIAEIEKLMEKEGISDYSLGARLYAAETNPAKPSYEPSDHQWNLPAFDKEFDIKDSAKLKQISRAKAYQVIDEIRNKRVH